MGHISEVIRSFISSSLYITTAQRDQHVLNPAILSSQKKSIEYPLITTGREARNSP